MEIINRANEILSLIEGNHEIDLNEEEVLKKLSANQYIDYRKDYYIDRIKKLDMTI